MSLLSKSVAAASSTTNAANKLVQSLVYASTTKNATDNAGVSEASVRAMSGLSMILRSFQLRGHLIAKTDPLNLPVSAGTKGKQALAEYEKLQWNPNEVLEKLGITESDMDVVLPLELADNKAPTLRSLMKSLEEAYAGSIGYEFCHIYDPEKVSFLMDKIQMRNMNLSNEDKKKLLKDAAESQVFEEFFSSKFPTTKRFGLDGCESAVACLNTIIHHSQAKHCLLGMAHRGRINVLTNVFKKPLEALMAEFQGKLGFGNTEYGNTGDVKYHLGVEQDIKHSVTGEDVHVSLLCNPSHLDTVDALLLGRARASQDRFQTDNAATEAVAFKSVLPIMVHGDSSLAGQGIIYETLQMKELDGYKVGGTVHVVVNNQIGFTTLNSDNLSTRYVTDIAKAFEVPVFHVNADDVEAVKFVSELAVEYRNKFSEDVFIDIIGYRRNGHNELDMPSFTQPEMYKKIAEHPKLFDRYGKELVNEGVVKEEDLVALRSSIMKNLEDSYKSIEKSAESCNKSYSYSPLWEHLAVPTDNQPPKLTGVEVSKLRALGREITTMPPSFSPHPTIKKLFDARVKMMSSGKGFDFGTAESLAFASLLSEGFNVRIAGQDAQRGTFSHRHAVIHDQINFARWSGLSDLVKNSKAFQVHNSLLNEYAALGYETGYSNHHPNTLAIWEAQFGDFANGAQIIIDTIIAAQEVKWSKQSGLVMYLPHGYDGMGPEHSSARIERFLQLCDNREDIINPVAFDPEQRRVIQTSNMQIINPTTPSNLFHALRRQLHRGFRKPLVVFQSKKLLKLRQAQSSIEDISEGTKFVPLYGAKVKNVDTIERVVLCSGQVFYDLDASLAKHPNVDKIALVRVEQLCPLPYDKILGELEKYPNLKTVVWAQEEPMNAGPWTYMNPRLQTLLRYGKFKVTQPIYAGRDVCAATAVGDPKIHAAELNQLLHDAYDLELNHHSDSSWWVVSPSGVQRGPSVRQEIYVHELADGKK